MNGARISRVIYEANISHNIAQEYLEMLNEKELIRQENGLFITTEKGKLFQELA
jgi:predicted transcriptional regulator